MTLQALLVAGTLVGGAGYLGLAGYVWLHRRAPGAGSLLVVMLAAAVWTGCYAVELGARSVAAALPWSAAKYLGIVALPPGLLCFALRYTGRSCPRWWVRCLLLVEPLVVLGVLVVPGARDLLQVYPDPLRAAGTLPAAPVAGAGPLFWPHAVYSYALILGGTGMLAVRLSRIARPYRRQARAVIGATLLPLVGNLVWNLGLLGAGTPDPVPFLAMVLAAVLVWGFFRLRMLDIVPVARDTVLDQLVDGVVVLDVYDRVVDANPAALVLLLGRDGGTGAAVGRYVHDLAPGLAPLLDAHRAGARGEDLPPAGGLPGGTGRELAATVAPLTEHGRPVGRAVVLRDVTETVHARHHLEELLEERTRLADSLRAGLLPAELPRVPGLRLAARFRPSGTDGRVSGDFYDVHRVPGGDWAFVLGDVAGSGVGAALVTSTARSAVRTLGAEGRAPREVLEHLNRALLAEGDPDRYCTVVYGRVDGADLLRGADLPEIAPVGAGPTAGPGDAAGATCRGAVWAGGTATRAVRLGPVGGRSTVRVTLALGGHPPPLLRRADGEVVPVGEPGTVLGLLPAVDVVETTVALRSGEVLVAFTDGVTEARRGAEQFGEERLAAVLGRAAAGLQGRSGPSVAALTAEAVADRVLDAVAGWTDDLDDVALLVLAVV